MPSIFQRLRRVTSGATWIPEIDGLRFVAIFAVVMYHVAGQIGSKSVLPLTTHDWYLPLTKIMSNGGRGVQLFFVISGFILGRPFARHSLLGEKPVPLAGYYLRRLTRLEPPYLLNLLLSAIAIYFYFHIPVRELTAHFLVSALYLHDLVYHRVSILNGVTWTLEIEIQFYVLVPLLVLVYRIRNGKLRRSLMVAVILFCCGFEEWAFQHNFWGGRGEFVYDTVLIYLQFFLSGLLLSDIYLTLLPRWRPHIAWDAASLACWITLFYLNSGWDAYLQPPLMIIVFLGAFRGIYFPRLFRMEPIALIGGMCYSIYLWHFFVIAFVFKASRYVHVSHDYLVNLLLQCALLLPPVLLFSVAMYLLIERPCMDPRWPQKLLAKWKAAAGRPAAA